MVIRRTINSLKTRPHDERLAFAGMCALFVMVVLTGAWGAVFFKNIQNAAVEESYQPSAQTAVNQQAAAAALSSIVQSTITSDPGAQASDDLASTTIDSTDTTSDTLPPASNGTTDVASQLQAALHQ